MKKNLHPKLYIDATVTCACGDSFTTLSTEKEIKVEICSNCHPFYTGQQKYIDTEGRIEKFTKKVEHAKNTPIKTKKKRKVAKEKTSKEPTLKEMMDNARKSS
jgi:large subunit ribosomal protein L31